MLTGVLEHVYVLAEPPGEPYYIGRVMEFVAKESKQQGHEDDIMDQYWVRVNWMYRPTEISKKAMDSRMLYLTMYSDLCPLQSLRGKCTVKHLEHVENLQRYRATPSCFWFDKLYDRYITRLFEVIPSEKVLNLPKKFYDLLVERYRYIIIEVNKSKDICSQPHYCHKCSEWCSPEDSVCCYRCHVDYHMLCVDPPITRRPPRGFGWSCAACNGELEKKLEEGKGIKSNRLSLLLKKPREEEQQQQQQQQEQPPSSEEQSQREETKSQSPPRGSNGSTANPSNSSTPPPVSRYQELEQTYDEKVNNAMLTPEQEHLLKMWPFRYFGMHSSIEDLLEIDDYINPRAASRVSPKHQATVSDWPGRPVVYIEQEKSEKRGRKKMARKTDNTPILKNPEYDHFQSVPKKDRPPWVQVKPVGYIERGGDKTSTLMWKNPENDETGGKKVEEFLEKTEPYAQKLEVAANTPNFIDFCLKAYMDNNYDEAAALNEISSVQRKTIKEPTLTAEEKARFEEGVRKHGSELHEVCKEVRTKKSADIVRYYYLWKKTPKGHEIWDNFRGRKSKKKPDTHNHVLHHGPIDEIADNSDDSAYDNEKAKAKKRTFFCKFCETTTSRAWRRAPGYPVAEPGNPVVALCIRCARLWRRYAVVWEDPEEVARKVNQKGAVAWKRKVEEELVEDMRAIFAEREKERERENTRKKMKLEKQQKEKGAQAAVAAVVASSKGQSSNKATTVPPQEAIKNEDEQAPISQQTITQAKDKTESPTMAYDEDQSAKVILRRCAVCNQVDPVAQHLFCQSCGLNVHTKCYGAQNAIPNGSWLCDCCSNDLRPVVSTLYVCTLCPIRENNETAITTDTPGASDALKRTSDSNWAHVRCAVWTPEVKFGDVSKLQPIEGISNIPQTRFKGQCSICVMTGACISCGCCSESFHVGCAGRKGFAFGFSIDPVKYEDGKPTVTFGQQTGVMAAVVLCPHHREQIDNLVGMYEVDPTTGKTAFQIFCEVYKQSEVASTGAMRRSTLYSTTDHYIPKAEKTSDDNVTLVLSDSAKHVNDVELASTKSCNQCHTQEASYWIEREETGVICPKCYWSVMDRGRYEQAYAPKTDDRISIIDTQGPEVFNKIGNFALQSITARGLQDVNNIQQHHHLHQHHQQHPHHQPQYTANHTSPYAEPREMRTSVTNLLNPVPAPPPPPPPQPATNENTPAPSDPTNGNNNNDENDNNTKEVRRSAALGDILI